MRFTARDEEFRQGVRAWLRANLTGEFAALRGAGGPGREHEQHELAMEVLGAESMTGHDEWQRLFLFSRAETIYGGSDEIQRNIIATRALGLPRPQSP